MKDLPGQLFYPLATTAMPVSRSLAHPAGSCARCVLLAARWTCADPIPVPAVFAAWFVVRGGLVSCVPDACALQSRSSPPLFAFALAHLPLPSLKLLSLSSLHLHRNPPHSIQHSGHRSHPDCRHHTRAHPFRSSCLIGAPNIAGFPELTGQVINGRWRKRLSEIVRFFLKLTWLAVVAGKRLRCRLETRRRAACYNSSLSTQHQRPAARFSYSP
jgi:hypothetical protein